MSGWNEKEFVAFDLETTGLSPAFDRIVEIGAVRFRADGTELARLNQLVDPCRPIPQDAMRVHGITDEMVRGQPPIDAVLPQFVEFLGDEETILLAHNAPFDVGFLSMVLGRLDGSAPENPVVDTLELAQCRLRCVTDYKLQTLARELDICDGTQHRALDDALVVKSLFLKLLEMRPRIPEPDELFRITWPLYLEKVDPAFLDVAAEYEPLLEAIENHRSLSIVYGGGTKGARKRRITPKDLIEYRGYLYLVAHCHIDDMEKHFRLDRILDIAGN